MEQQPAVGGQVFGARKPGILVLGWFFFLVSPYATGQKVPLDQTEILGRLAAGNTASYVAHLVKTRGVSFSVSQDFLYRVKLAGGEGILTERLLSAEQSGQPQSVFGKEASLKRLAKCAELIHAGATDLAEKECRISIEESPQSPWPLLATARLLNPYDLTGNLVETSREDPAERTELLRRAAALGPNLAMVHQAIAITLDPAEAMAELENATRLDAEQLEVSETIAQEIPLIGYVGGDEEGSDLGASSNEPAMIDPETDRKSTRLNSSHGYISYAVFCLKKQNIMQVPPLLQRAFKTCLTRVPARSPTSALESAITAQNIRASLGTFETYITPN